MKTPEEIALIGGGILLSSGLVFGLKSGAASELPNVERSVGTVLQGNSNSAPSNTNNGSAANQESSQQQQADKFNDGFKQAQQKGWQTGQWGTAKFYVDDNENMHVGSGRLNSTYSKIVNDNQIKTISLDGAVQAPQDSSSLFADSNSEADGYHITSLTSINRMSNLDTSHTTDMYNMFNGDSNLTSLDVSHLDTSHTTDMYNMFNGDSNLTSLDVSHFDTSSVTSMRNMFANDMDLTSLDVSHFDTSKVTNMEAMFYDDSSLSSLDLSNFDTSNVTNMNTMFSEDSLSSLNLSNLDTSNVTDVYNMFLGTNIHKFTLGSNTKLQNNSNNDDYYANLAGTYQNGDQTLTANQLMDGNAHPGTWYKQ